MAGNNGVNAGFSIDMVVGNQNKPKTHMLMIILNND